MNVEGNGLQLLRSLTMEKKLSGNQSVVHNGLDDRPAATGKG